jgi:hypothetical protein
MKKILTAIFVCLVFAMCIYLMNTISLKTSAQAPPNPNAILAGYNCSADSYLTRICKIYDPETQHHYIVVQGYNSSVAIVRAD